MNKSFLKKMLSVTTIGVLCVLAVVTSARAATLTFSNLVTYAASGGITTNYGVPVLIGTATVPIPPSISFAHAGLASTNAVIVYVQIGTSTVSNQMTTVAVIAPSVTNALTEAIPAPTISVPIYLQTAIVTTNNSTAGTTAAFLSP